MRRSWVDDAGVRAFAEAIRAVEARSAAEVVVRVRHHSGSYLHADLITGVLCGLGALAFMLFSTTLVFSTTAIFVDSLLLGIAGGLLNTQLPFVRRMLTLPKARARRVREAAEAAFHSRGIHKTRNRTGMLAYVSLLEGRVELVCDTGVEDALGDAEIERAAQELERALRREYRPIPVARALAALDQMLGAKLPASADDINELPDEVDH